MAPEALPAPRWRHSIAAGLVVFLAAMGLRLLGLADAPMIPDEYYTIMAARSVAKEGVPRIGSGEYRRVPEFTALVAASLTAFGDSVRAARLPAAVPSALIVLIAFLWLRRAAGPLAGWLLALLLALSGSAIEIGQFSRFYALHALLYLGCAVAVYELLQAPRVTLRPTTAHGRRSVLLILVAAGCAFAAWRLQATTAIGVLALAVPVAFTVLHRSGAHAVAMPRRTALLMSAAIACIAAVGFVAVSSGWLSRTFETYRWAALWSAELRDYPLFYVHALARDMPLLLYTFPIAFTVALARAPRPAIFCITVCAVAVALHSFAGMKAVRYIHYLWPLLLAPWAIAGAVLLSAVGRAAAEAARHLASWSPSLPRIVLRTVPPAAVAAAAAVALAGNPEFDKLRSLPVDIAAAFDAGPRAAAVRARAEDERRMVAAVRHLVQSDGLFVTSSDLLALWHLGRFDLELRAGRLKEFEPGTEFSRDPRTGAIVISEPQSLQQVMACLPSGTVIVWPGDWRRRSRVTHEAADFLEARMQEIPLPGTEGARAFGWKSDAPIPPSCAALLARHGPAVRSVAN